MSDPLPFTLIVIAQDEAKCIGRCLDSVPFAAEKLVVDSGSTDGTPEIAAAHGARVVHQRWLGFGRQRNAAASFASHDWILTLDADEELSPELSAELQTRLPEILSSPLAGGRFRRRTSFMGAPMHWYRPMTRERVSRLYHRERARWTEQRVHESLRFDGKVVEFRERILHHHNPTLVHRQLKMLRYTELRAQDWRDRQRPVGLWMCPLLYFAIFFKEYVLRFGALDGARGFAMAQMAACYAVYKRLRYFELSVNASSAQAAREVLQLREGA